MEANGALEVKFFPLGLHISWGVSSSVSSQKSFQVRSCWLETPTLEAAVLPPSFLVLPLEFLLTFSRQVHLKISGKSYVCLKYKICHSQKEIFVLAV